MIEENATVQDINKGVVTLQTIKSSACGGCKESDTCSTSILSKYFANKSIELNLDTDLPVKIGDYVTVGLEEQALVRLTVLIYFIPIIVHVCVYNIGYVHYRLFEHHERAVDYSVCFNRLGWFVYRLEKIW